MIEMVARKKIREKSLKEIQNTVHNARKNVTEFLSYLNNYTKDEYDTLITIVAMGDYLKEVGEHINELIKNIEKTID